MLYVGEFITTIFQCELFIFECEVVTKNSFYIMFTMELLCTKKNSFEESCYRGNMRTVTNQSKNLINSFDDIVVIDLC